MQPIIQELNISAVGVGAGGDGWWCGQGTEGHRAGNHRAALQPPCLNCTDLQLPITAYLPRGLDCGRP